jgi:hypothetical protein
MFKNVQKTQKLSANRTIEAAASAADASTCNTLSKKIKPFLNALSKKSSFCSVKFVPACKKKEIKTCIERKEKLIFFKIYNCFLSMHACMHASDSARVIVRTAVRLQQVMSMIRRPLCTPAQRISSPIILNRATTASISSDGSDLHRVMNSALRKQTTFTHQCACQEATFC